MKLSKTNSNENTMGVGEQFNQNLIDPSSGFNVVKFKFDDDGLFEVRKIKRMKSFQIWYTVGGVYGNGRWTRGRQGSVDTNGISDGYIIGPNVGKVVSVKERYVVIEIENYTNDIEGYIYYF